MDITMFPSQVIKIHRDIVFVSLGSIKIIFSGKIPNKSKFG